MKTYIRFISLIIILCILLLALSIRYFEYDKQQIEKMFIRGKYKYSENFNFYLNDSLVENKTNKEYQNIMFNLIQINYQSDIKIDPVNKRINLENKLIDMTISYKLRDSLLFEAVRLNTKTIRNCEN